jgi:ligand-binding SRPBCC domain-containing protein
MARIVDFDWNSHFVDEHVRGPFRQFRHRHGVESETREGVEGTLVADVIEYESPGGAVGWLAEDMIRRRFEEAFGYRHKRLPEILAIAAQQAVRRQ